MLEKENISLVYCQTNRTDNNTRTQIMLDLV